ncbi:MAG TPA: hypothetical protein VKX31_03710 [Brumimicrobium sp.]|nr:hypothetical protein [Brumimicrobium sp.]
MGSSISSKRHEALNSFSREYHYCLSFSWKVRKGLSNHVSFERIKTYCDWFFANYLNRLIQDEEKFLLLHLDEESSLVRKIRAEHRRFRRLFTETEDLEKALHYIEEELDRSARFKEKELFAIIEEEIPSETLDKVVSLRPEVLFIENTKDKFWL